MNYSRLIPSIAAAFGVSILHSAALAQVEIRGRVTDQQQKPIAGVPVSAWDQDGEWSISTKTDENGRFSLNHKNCDKVFVEVAPPLKSSLASALFEGLPGDKTRQIIVHLRKGFAVRGKVVRENGQGIKGVVVKISSLQQAGSGNAHDGGAIVTASDGSFKLILTPGAKMMQIINSRYPDLKERVEQRFQVTFDGSLDPVIIPRRN
ncbi:MAG TPA: carboxypeptidase regulatory-like domain-containing protein [Candidatus Obscuribacterales bacterium]